MPGYHNAVLVLLFILLEADTSTVDIICKVRSQSNSTLTLDQSSTDASQVSFYKGEHEIATSRDLSLGGWDDFIDENYKSRVFLNTTDEMKIHLKNVTRADEAIYTTYVILKTQEQFVKIWNITVEDFTKPVLKEKFKITVEENGGDFICKCGSFEDDKIKQLSFHWNISENDTSTLSCEKNVSATCSARWPVSECQDVIHYWTAEHRGKEHWRKRRSTEGDSGCKPDLHITLLLSDTDDQVTVMTVLFNHRSEHTKNMATKAKR